MKGPRVTSPIQPNFDGLLGLSRRHGVDIKPTLLRVLTDLYIQKPTHSAEEEAQYTTLALRLLDVVDVATRAIVSQKLAAYAGTPADVLRRLYGDDVASARTSQAPGISPWKEADDAAGQPARTSNGTTAAELTALFFAADSIERRLILVNLKYADAIATGRMRPGDQEQAIRRLEEAALGGRPGDFIREIERTLGITRMMAQMIVSDPSGEPIVVAAKVVGMPLPVLQRILLFVNRAFGQAGI